VYINQSDIDLRISISQILICVYQSVRYWFAYINQSDIDLCISISQILICIYQSVRYWFAYINQFKLWQFNQIKQ